jgi:hypothetical protein
MRLAILAGFLALGFGADAQPASNAQPGAPVVVELFTSQSCSSCPPAEALFRDYAKRSDLIALEWHVDYWDDLQVFNAGRWKDPYSKAAWTSRQRAYNRAIKGKGNVYTPQAVIAGANEATGFDRSAIDRLIGAAAAKAPAMRVTATRTDKLSFSATAMPSGAEAMLVTFRADAVTSVKGGENKGRSLSSAHLVTDVRKLGPGPAFTAPLPAEGAGCALLIHARNQGPILAAAYCP